MRHRDEETFREFAEDADEREVQRFLREQAAFDARRAAEDLFTTISWHTIGTGHRAHAFDPDNLLFAYRSQGPGNPEVSSSAQCRHCWNRLLRIAAQNAAYDDMFAQK